MTSEHPAVPTAGDAHWLGRADLPWNILLDVRVDPVPRPEVLRERLALLCARSEWPAPPADAVRVGETDRLLAELGALTGAHPVSVGRTPTGLVVRAHHAYVDGLGLLAVTRDLLGGDLTSRAAGIGDRPSRSSAATMAARLVEVAFRPPATVAGTPSTTEVDVFAGTVLRRPVRTSQLAHAGIRAVVAHNRSAGLRAEHVAVAVGVSTTGGADLRVGDHSGFLRLTDVERLSCQELETALAAAPLQLGGTARTASARRVGGAVRWASEAFAGRLGSTLLVSHLGRVDSPGLGSLAFYPLSGTGSGVSLGAAATEGGTVVTLRARGTAHGDADLAELLGGVVAQLT